MAICLLGLIVGTLLLERTTHPEALSQRVLLLLHATHPAHIPVSTFHHARYVPVCFRLRRARRLAREYPGRQAGKSHKLTSSRRAIAAETNGPDASDGRRREWAWKGVSFCNLTI